MEMGKTRIFRAGCAIRKVANGLRRARRQAYMFEVQIGTPDGPLPVRFFVAGRHITLLEELQPANRAEWIWAQIMALHNMGCK